MTKMDEIRLAAKSFNREFSRKELYQYLVKHYNWSTNDNKKFNDYLWKLLVKNKINNAFLIETKKHHYIDENVVLNEIIDDPALVFELYQKINEINGIRDLCNELTSNDSNPEYVRIVLKRRKKMTSWWYNKVYEFITNNNHPCINDDVQLLKATVSRVLNANDIYTYNESIKLLLIKILGIIAGLNVNTIVYDEANKYISELINNNVKLIIVLLGEYIDNGKSCLEYSRESLSTIILYLDNINDSSNQNNIKYEDLLYTTLAHEYFHFHHFFNIKNVKHPNHKVYLKKLDEYIPGTVIIEGLASYFEHEYSIRKSYVLLSRDIEKSWNENDMNYYPYATAKYILNHSHFNDVFNSSLYNISSSYKILK